MLSYTDTEQQLIWLGDQYTLSQYLHSVRDSCKSVINLYVSFSSNQEDSTNRALGTSVCLRNVVRTNDLLCQVVTIPPLSSHFLSRSMDKAYDIFWHNNMFHLLHGNRDCHDSPMCSQTWRNMVYGTSLLALPQRYNHDVCPGNI